MRKAILAGWFVISLATAASAQEKGKWKFHESKDDSTGEVTKYLTVYSDLPDIRLLITSNKGGHDVSILSRAPNALPYLFHSQERLRILVSNHKSDQ